jgi:hypothetical protein
MAMANVWHIVIHIKILFAVRVIQPHTLAAHQVKRLTVEKSVGRSEEPFASFEQRRRI